MAGFAETQDEDDVIAQINIIPFVDIALVLLVIFMLTANLIARATIDVELPTAANAGEAVDATVNVVITAAGALFLDGKPIDGDALRSELQARVQTDPKLHAVIAADKAVRYERVVRVIDVLKSVGVTAFALNIERAETVQP